MNNAEFQRSLLRARTLAHGGDTDYWSGFQCGGIAGVFRPAK